MDVRLVPPAVWQPLIDGAWHGDERALAQSILATVQGQHVGITPMLVGELVQSLRKRGEPVGKVWRTVYQRLLRTLEALAGERRGGTMGGIVLHAVPYHYVVLRLVIPLVDLACQRIGRSYLFCEDDGDISDSDYSKYRSNLNESLVMLAEDDAQHPTFWAECAITLRTMSKTGNWQSAENAPLPIPDPNALSLFLALDPITEQGKRRDQRSLKLTNRRREVNPRIVDAGVDGIRQARSPDDLPHILLSEFMVPTVVRNDRLANNEFFVIKRPPKPVRLRDVLIVGVLPGDIRDEATRTFIKACWFDTLVWLSQRLRQSGLEQSEFRWIEGDRYGRWRSKSFLLEEMPNIVLQQEMEQVRAYRQQFLLTLRWLPSFLDQQASYESGVATSGWDGFKTWLRQSWHGQRENRHWQTTRQTRRRSDQVRFVDSTLSESPLDINQFAFVHLMTFLPTSLQTQTQRTQLGEVGAVLRFGSQPSRSVSLTWVPEPLQVTEGWRLDGRAWRERRLVKPTADSLNKIAANVIEGWQTVLLKEMQRG